MTNFENDFSELFMHGQDAPGRMLDFGQRVNGLVSVLRSTELVVPLDDDAVEQVLLRQSTVPAGHRYRQTLPGVEIVDSVSGQQFGTIASTAHHEQKVFSRKTVVAGGIHFQAPGAWFSVEADYAAFLNPRTIEMRKEPFHNAVQLLGRTMLRIDTRTQS